MTSNLSHEKPTNTLLSTLEYTLSINTTTKNTLEGHFNAHGGAVLLETGELRPRILFLPALGLYLVVEMAVLEDVTCTIDPFLVKPPMTPSTVSIVVWRDLLAQEQHRFSKRRAGRPRPIREKRRSTDDISDAAMTIPPLDRTG